MHKSLTPLLLLLPCALVGVTACGQPPTLLDGARPIDPYPLEDTPADCTHLPALCGLPLVDLGGGADKNAQHLVFIGDGYEAYALDEYRYAVQLLRAGLTHHPRVVIADHPDLFHFWRVDLESRSPFVDDDDWRNTPLGAHLREPEMCGGRRFIATLDDRVSLAVRAARTADGDFPPSTQITPVVLSRRSAGTANADVYGGVRLSSRDDLNTLRHELGHALFRLGDEYEEFTTCDEDGALGVHGPPPPLTEFALLTRPNVTASDGPDKWRGLVDGAEPGGARWPCPFHPTPDCLMLGTSDALCPVCAATAAEHIALMRCEADAQPPAAAVHHTWTVDAGGSHLVLYGAGHDERGPVEVVGWTTPDGSAAFTAGPFAVIDLAARTAGDVITVTVRDAAGHETVSPPFLIPDAAFPVLGDVEVGPLQSGGFWFSARTGPHGWVVLRGVDDETWLRADASGVVEALLGGPGFVPPRQVVAHSQDRRAAGPAQGFAAGAWAPAAPVELPPVQFAALYVANTLAVLEDSKGEPFTLLREVAPRLVLRPLVSTCSDIVRISVRQGDHPAGTTTVRDRTRVGNCADWGETFVDVPVVVDLVPSDAPLRLVVTDALGRTVEHDTGWVPEVDAALLYTAAIDDGALRPFSVPSSAVWLVEGGAVREAPVHVGAGGSAQLFPAALPPAGQAAVIAAHPTVGSGVPRARTTYIEQWDNLPPLVVAAPGGALVLDDGGAVLLVDGTGTLAVPFPDDTPAWFSPDPLPAVRDLAGNHAVVVTLPPPPAVWPADRCGGES